MTGPDTICGEGKKIKCLSIYLHILPYTLTDILGSFALSSNVSRKEKE